MLTYNTVDVPVDKVHDRAFKCDTSVYLHQQISEINLRDAFERPAGSIQYTILNLT